MAISLNQIISTLSDTVGQPFNVPLQEKLKVIINYKRANYTQQFLEKHPNQRRFFQQSFTLDLEKIPKGDCDIPNVTCDILRSTCLVPTPIRSDWSMFDFIGTPDWTVSYGETKPEYNRFNNFNRFTSKLTKWSYINKKLYIFNNLQLKMIAGRSVFPDPNDVNKCCSSPALLCYSDDSEYPVSPDILNSIMRDVLNVELKTQFGIPQPDLVTMTEETKTSNQ